MRPILGAGVREVIALGIALEGIETFDGAGGRVMTGREGAGVVRMLPTKKSILACNEVAVASNDATRSWIDSE